jgi:hypothetical protein
MINDGANICGKLFGGFNICPQGCGDERDLEEVLAEGMKETIDEEI